jgi:hypothetical protein
MKWLLLLLGVGACRGAADDYNDFLARRPDAGANQTIQSTLEDVSGVWLLHALLAGGLDLGLRAQLTMDLKQTPIPMHAKMWLAISDYTTEPPLVETDTTVAADGTFDLHAEPLVLMKGTTPGINVDVRANAVLHASTQNMTAFCGTATGTVEQPLALDLAGSTFAARPDSRTLQITDVPQSCFPKDGSMMPPMVVKPPAPDLSSVSSMVADLSGNWIIAANLAGSLPLNLWAELELTPGTPDGGDSAGSLDGALRRATDAPGSLALASFTTQVSSDGRFQIWIPDLQVGQTQASVLLVGATRSADVFCGAGAGQVQKPIQLDLTGTTFGSVRWTPGTPLPSPIPDHCQ